MNWLRTLAGATETRVLPFSRLRCGELRRSGAGLQQQDEDPEAGDTILHAAERTLVPANYSVVPPPVGHCSAASTQSHCTEFQGLGES